MKHLPRILWYGLTGISVLLLVGSIILRVRSATVTDVFMIPTGSESGILFTSHWPSGWGELTVVERWPGPRLGWWSGPGWENVGPFLLNGGYKLVPPPHYSRFWLKYFWTEAGPLMIAKESATGSIAYENSMTRARQLGFPNSMPPPPQTAVVLARHRQFSLGTLIGIFSVLPVIALIRWRLNAHKRFARHARQCCIDCGYSLVGNLSGVCPECGRKVNGVERAQAS